MNGVQESGRKTVGLKQVISEGKGHRGGVGKRRKQPELKRKAMVQL